MRQKPFPMLFDNQLARVACMFIGVGIVAYLLFGWGVAGWAGLVLGVAILFLAHQVAISVVVDDEFEESPVPSHAVDLSGCYPDADMQARPVH